MYSNRILVACALLLSVETVFASLTSSQLSSIFPEASNGTLFGSSKTVHNLDVTVVTNSTHALWHVNSTDSAVEKTGWLAIGLGSKMSNSDYLIGWPMVSDSNVSWVLSHRLPNGGHGTPRMASTSSAEQTTDFYHIVPELSTSTTGSSFTTLAWLRALEPPSDYPTSSAVSNAAVDRTTTSLEMIYASASKDPASTNEASDVAQHNRPYGSFLQDISQPVNLAVTSPFGEGKTSTNGWSKRDKVLIAHATIGGIGAVLFVPARILLARFGRSGSWFPAHRAIQIFSAVLIVVAAIVGIIENEGGHFEDTHQRLGIILLALFLVQPALGVFAHWTKGGAPLTSAHPSLSRPYPSIVRLIHIVMGVATTGLAYWQVASGFDEWQTDSDRQDSVPIAVQVVFWILLAIAVMLYVTGWIWGTLRGGNLRRSSSEDTIDQPRGHLTSEPKA
ncbi:uncharacterized protein JCM6883_003427 [Sporobolomyces salmoneus]|uniref:uncharacterized protein n=1 Tax=Sporobolomyces salmoneus TaxID=183962 RepID=UPI00316BACB1